MEAFFVELSSLVLENGAHSYSKEVPTGLALPEEEDVLVPYTRVKVFLMTHKKFFPVKVKLTTQGETRVLDLHVVKSDWNKSRLYFVQRITHLNPIHNNIVLAANSLSTQFNFGLVTVGQVWSSPCTFDLYGRMYFQVLVSVFTEEKVWPHFDPKSRVWTVTAFDPARSTGFFARMFLKLIEMRVAGGVARA